LVLLRLETSRDPNVTARIFRFSILLLSYRLAVAKPNFIELPGVEPIAILYEDRSVLAIDKPRGWMLLPVSWQNTRHNLQAALNSSIAARDFWACSRNLKYLRYVHRLDGDTTGILLIAKSPGSLATYSALFESRRMEKTYLAVVHGAPKQTEWVSKLKLAPSPGQTGTMKVDARDGKQAETHFRVLATTVNGSRRREEAEASPGTTPNARLVTSAATSLIEARPFTGRTHQIRVHLAQGGHPVVGDDLYGRADDRMELGLRAVALAYHDPFTRRRVEIRAPIESFCREYKFDMPEL
jgi:23S rRNA-/tRNA-specific pseudouridylate synthase